MVVIIAHVDGPSGSGKTTIGKRIEDVCNLVKIVDIDDIRNCLTAIYPNRYKTKYNNNHEKFIFDNLEQGLKKYIRPFRFVVLVGGCSVSYKNEIKLVHIETKHKYYIDIDEEILIKQRFERHLNFMAQNVERYYKKAIKGPLCIDFNNWRKYNLYHDVSKEVSIQRYQSAGYKIVGSNDIVVELTNFLQNLKICQPTTKE